MGIRVCGTERTNVVVSMTVGVGTLAVYSLVLLITQLTAADLNKNLIMISRKRKVVEKVKLVNIYLIDDHAVSWRDRGAHKYL